MNLQLSDLWLAGDLVCVRLHMVCVSTLPVVTLRRTFPIMRTRTITVLFIRRARCVRVLHLQTQLSLAVDVRVPVCLCSYVRANADEDVVRMTTKTSCCSMPSVFVVCAIAAYTHADAIHLLVRRYQGGHVVRLDVVR